MTTKRNLWIMVILLFLVLISGCSDSPTGVAKTATVNLGISLEGSGHIIGTVVVRLRNNNGNPAHVYERLATSQTVTISDVAYGEYTLIVTHGGYTHMDNNFTVQSIEINRIVTLSIATNVSFYINTDNGGSVAGAIVKLVNNDNASNTYQQTALSTKITFENVIHGTYTLTITLNGYRDYLRNSRLIDGAGLRVPLITLINENSLVGTIGPAGGLIFHDKGNNDGGWRYLEAAPAETEFNAEWGAYTGSWDTGNYVGIDVSGVSRAIGSGEANTYLIVAKLAELGETGRAAQLCRALKINGFDDWFLPSMEELNLMHQNLREQGLGEFGAAEYWYYWSSSQATSGGAWLQNFYHGSLLGPIRSYSYRVRAVRAF